MLGSLAIGLVSIPVSLVSERFLPAPLVAYLDFQAGQEITTTEAVLAVVGIVIAAITIWNFIQLYRFRYSARPIAIALTIFWMLIMLFLGPVVESPVSGIFTEASALIWGAVMAMMYCKPYDGLFTHD